MQFDVVVGNPPYNPPGAAAAGQEIWSKFVDYGLSATRDGGHLSFITPTGWRLPSKVRFAKRGVHERVNRCVRHWGNCKDRFGASIGTSIDVDWWLLQKGDEPARGVQFMPRSSDDRLGVSIFSKLHSFEGPRLQLIKNKMVPAPGEWKCAWTSARWRRDEWQTLRDRRSVSHFESKVVISSSGSTGAFYDPGALSTRNHSHGIRVKDRAHAQRVIDILEGPFVEFMTRELVSPGSLENPAVWIVPYLPDGNTYALLHLTQEEINHIERRVTHAI